jgi:hypothetical protein
MKPPTTADGHTRESWLEAAYTMVRLFYPEDTRPPQLARVGVGFPGDRRRGRRSRSSWETWHPDRTTDGTTQVYITPLLGDDIDGAVAALMGGMTAAALPADEGCGRRFRALFQSVGLEGASLHPQLGPAVKAKLGFLRAALGPLPHAAVTPRTKKAEACRALKATCPVGDCDGAGKAYVVRVSRYWIDNVGGPECPTHSTAMQLS